MGKRKREHREKVIAGLEPMHTSTGGSKYNPPMMMCKKCKHIIPVHHLEAHMKEHEEARNGKQ